MKTTLPSLCTVVFLIALGCDKPPPEGDDQPPEEDTLSVGLSALGGDDRLEIVTWNIEQFPKSRTRTKKYVKAIVEELSADIYCLQEIQDESQFRELLSSMEDYDYVLAEYSYMISLAVVYRPEHVTVNSQEELWHDTAYNNDGDDDIRNNAQYQFASRPPLNVDLTWTDGKRSKDITLINIHMKCCGNGRIDERTDDEEFRRRAAGLLLREFVRENLPDSDVIIAGDWNDAIDEPEPTNVFWSLTADSADFRFVDWEIATGSEDFWSWPGWESSYPAIHFDHILISNELFNEYESDDSKVETLRIEDYLDGGATEYNAYISDHRPVVWTFKP